MMKTEKSFADIAVALIAIAWSAVMAGLFIWGARDERDQTEKLAKRQARACFEVIVAARSWNASHGGVYAPVTCGTAPNPYLKDPRRDFVSQDGVELTKINPAYMTRQIAEIAAKKNMVRLHITSEKPIRPANAPDQWERAALKSFSSGAQEASGFVDSCDGNTLFRFMAPLRIEQGCLECHSSQGCEPGDLRGGISVTFEAEPFLSIQNDAVGNLAAVFGCIWGLGLAGLFVGHRLLKKEEARRIRVIAELRESLANVKTLSGLLPICCICKQIRTDQGYWKQIEAYISEHSDAEFSHGICPECVKKHYPDLDIF